MSAASALCARRSCSPGYCGVGCTLTVHVQEEKIVKVTSPIENGVTRGHLCIKGRFGWEWVNQRG